MNTRNGYHNQNINFQVFDKNHFSNQQNDVSKSDITYLFTMYSFIDINQLASQMEIDKFFNLLMKPPFRLEIEFSDKNTLPILKRLEQGTSQQCLTDLLNYCLNISTSDSISNLLMFEQSFYDERNNKVDLCSLESLINYNFVKTNHHEKPIMFPKKVFVEINYNKIIYYDIKYRIQLEYSLTKQNKQFFLSEQISTVINLHKDLYDLANLNFEKLLDLISNCDHRTRLRLITESNIPSIYSRHEWWVKYSNYRSPFYQTHYYISYLNLYISLYYIVLLRIWNIKDEITKMHLFVDIKRYDRKINTGDIVYNNKVPVFAFKYNNKIYFRYYSELLLFLNETIGTKLNFYSNSSPVIVIANNNQSLLNNKYYYNNQLINNNNLNNNNNSYFSNNYPSSSFNNNQLINNNNLNNNNLNNNNNSYFSNNYPSSSFNNNSYFSNNNNNLNNNNNQMTTLPMNNNNNQMTTLPMNNNNNQMTTLPMNNNNSFIKSCTIRPIKKSLYTNKNMDGSYGNKNTGSVTTTTNDNNSILSLVKSKQDLINCISKSDTGNSIIISKEKEMQQVTNDSIITTNVTTLTITTTTITPITESITNDLSCNSPNSLNSFCTENGSNTTTGNTTTQTTTSTENTTQTTTGNTVCVDNSSLPIQNNNNNLGLCYELTKHLMDSVHSIILSFDNNTNHNRRKTKKCFEKSPSLDYVCKNYPIYLIESDKLYDLLKNTNLSPDNFEEYLSI